MFWEFVAGYIILSLPCILKSSQGLPMEADVNEVSDRIADLHHLDLTQIRISLLDKWLLGAFSESELDQVSDKLPRMHSKKMLIVSIKFINSNWNNSVLCNIIHTWIEVCFFSMTEAMGLPKTRITVFYMKISNKSEESIVHNTFVKCPWLYIYYF